MAWNLHSYIWLWNVSHMYLSAMFFGGEGEAVVDVQLIVYTFFKW